MSNSNAINIAEFMMITSRGTHLIFCSLLYHLKQKISDKANSPEDNNIQRNAPTVVPFVNISIRKKIAKQVAAIVVII